MTCEMGVHEEPTSPYDDQRPGTSGLRKKVTRFKKDRYLENFVQSLFNAIPKSEYEDKTLLVSGDGRYWNKDAIRIIAGLAAGNGVRRLWIGQHGWMSTPAASCIIRDREGDVCRGGILLTASHNPGGPNGDFGIKYNCSNGSPAPETITETIYQRSLRVLKLKRVELPPFSLETLGVTNLTSNFSVEIINPVEDWLCLMKKIFDFDLLRSLVQNPMFSFVYDGLNGIAGPYAKAVFVDSLGCSQDVLAQCEPREDFGGCHPDPNLTYACRLVQQMAVFGSEEEKAEAPDFGAAGDGDNDRNMILGRGWFVTPSDSVAIIASYGEDCIPYFKNGFKGVARSMPTSKALARVAEQKGLKHYEVPTGWKFFGNLMDAGLCSLCGEESFGTGSDHIREKDGLWAVLAWLSILAYHYKSQNRIVSVREINENFWQEFGRNWYVRYDYEEVDATASQKLMDFVITANFDPHLATKMSFKSVEIFHYQDPVDKTISRNQGIQLLFSNDSRIVLRLSGTGSSGATIRIYFERFSKDYEGTARSYLASLIEYGLKMMHVREILGRQEPTVIT